MRSPANNDAQDSLTIGIADEHIGAVVGRAGRNITEIILASGARIKISDRDNWNIRSYSGSRVYDNVEDGDCQVRRKEV